MTNSFFLTRWLLAGMRWLYESIMSSGIQASYAIVLTIFIFTLGVRCLTIFSDIKSRKSSVQMQEIQPDLDRLMKKYQNDPKRMNQERSKLMKEKGVSIVYISHKMDEVFRIADDITVIRDGAVVSSDRAEDLDIDTVIARMVGRKMENVYPKEILPLGDKVFEVKNFCQKDWWRKQRNI